ncbi:MAG: 2-hydroxyacyl-CoA dehydratase family protein [Planctomycetota bacterium]
MPASETDLRIGITTTIPVEAVFAAGRVPVDLNNMFVTSPHASEDVALAERCGFPRSFCAWVKGIYGALHRAGIRSVIGVTRGDCSETHALLEVWASEGVEVIPFAYPEAPDPAALLGELERLAERLGTTLRAAEAEKARLDPVRAAALTVDRLAWEERRVSGGELLGALLNTSDFCGDPEVYGETCERLLLRARARAPASGGTGLGLLGVPPIFSDLCEVLEVRGARVLFHETPRQFALPGPGDTLARAYSSYTYPYGATLRIRDIRAEARRRGLEGLVHYVQSFCHRQLHDRLLREALEMPILTIEGDRPGPVDERTKTRIEAFLETLRKGRS